MIKNILCGLLLASAFVGQAQLNYPINTQKLKNHVGHHSFEKALDGVMTTENSFIPGDTLDITFTLNMNVNAQELELGDSLAMTFPAGVTIVSTQNDPEFEPGIPGATSENLNGINGQTISWGDNDNGAGGIIGQGTNVIIRLIFADTLNADLNVALFISSDQGTGTPAPFPADLTASVILPMRPTNPDFTTENYATNVLTKVPMHLVLGNQSFSGVTVNKGGNFTGSAFYNFTLSAFSDSVQITSPMANLGTDTVSTGFNLGLSTGTHTVVHNINYTDDANQANNTTTFDIFVGDSTLARDNGDFSSSYPFGPSIDVGAGPSELRLASAFSIKKSDSITSVDVYLMNQVGGDDVYVTIHDFSGSVVGNQLATSETYTTVANATSWVNLKIASGFVITPTEFAMVIHGESATNGTVARLGIGSGNYLDGSNLIIIPAANFSADISAAGLHGSFGLRANFGAFEGPINPDLYMVNLDYTTDYPTLPSFLWNGMTPIDVSFTVKNAGTAANQGGEVKTEVLDGNGAIKFTNNTPVSSVNPGDSLNVNLSGAFDLSTWGVGVYTITSIFEGTGDVNLANDTVSFGVEASDSTMTRTDGNLILTGPIGNNIDLGLGAGKVNYGMLLDLGSTGDTLTSVNVFSLDFDAGDIAYFDVYGFDVANNVPDSNNILASGTYDVPAAVATFNIPANSPTSLSGLVYVEIGLIPAAAERNIILSSGKYQANTCFIQTGGQYFDASALNSGEPLVPFFNTNFGSLAPSAIRDIKSANFGVYPNPSNGLISLEGVNNGLVSIYSLDGKMVQEMEATKKMDVSALNTGTYILILRSDDSIYRTKLIIE
ncbi:MAG: hypothetical protein ACJAY8_000048 [Sphingobacteriales bacterium]|jgi:hypothetical protein